MRLRWMEPADTRILDYLQKEDTDCTAEEIVDALYYLPDYIEDRCQVLAEHGLVQPVDRTDVSYRIRELGVDFLKSDHRRRVLEKPP